MRKYLDCFLVLVLIFSATKGQNLNCNFDANNTCSWTQVRTDKANWLIRKGPTPSQYTGPPNDHTTNGPSGYYIYYETTGGNTGDIAQLQSPRLSVGSRTNCFTFWYYMYGQTVDTLNVYLKSGNRLGSPVWSRSHTQGQQWKQAVINIRNKRNIQIVIEAVKGRGFTGDIAVDDIFYKTGSCGQAGSVTPAPGSTGTVTCNFEAASMCGYQQDKTDNFDWNFSQGRTGTIGTGPANDHTLNTYYGHYVHMEATGHPANSKARLISPTFRSTRTQCLKFWYNMNGQDVDTLNVYVKMRSSLGNVLWSVSKHQGPQWNVGQVTIRGNSQSKNVVFEAVRGTGGDKGDIALDDVSIRNGGCSAPGYCNFETDFCTWTQGVGEDFDWTRRRGSTTTGGTGPTTDHTRRNSRGTYAYIEASSPRRPGDKAQLISENFKRSSRTKCFRFYYNMKGAQMGTLNAYVTSNGVKTLRWTLSGDQGSTWKQGRFPISSSRYDYTITLEGVRGQGETGDIAIDDTYLYTSSCSVIPSSARPVVTTSTRPPSTTSQTPKTTRHTHQSTTSCTFDYDLCGWTQLKDDQFDWTRRIGTTLSPGTGPSRDHTSGRGWYILTSASSRTVNQSGRIKSPQIRPGGRTQCLTFWYHMYGANVGTLNLYVQTLPSLGSPTWTRSASQGNRWNQGTVTLPSTGTYNLVFEVHNGNSYPGDVALDDINLQPCSGTQAPGATTARPGTSLQARKCTFESSNICHYTQDRTDNFNWYRDSGGTQTTGTGPSTDHTYNTRRGHYMYIEASSPRRRGDRARLLSPTYTDNSDICVQFWYHMYGNGVGTLNIYAMHGTVRGQAIFSRTGNQGNKWIVGRATVPQSTASRGYKVAFEGIVGTNYRGDIAIDDVSFTSGPCGNPGDCDFEHGLCTWTNTRTGDDFDWTQGSRGTSSTGTGPSSDHTLGTASGHYMYIETSSPRRPGDVAHLISQSFAPSAAGSCISFWYNMYGRTVDTLRVLVLVQGSADQAVWQISGAQGNSWHQGQAPINQTTKSYRVVFEGRRGQSYTGDIAIDDISFTTSACGVFPTNAVPPAPISTQSTPAPTTAGPFNCNFDPGLCGWSQDRTDNFDWIRTNRRTPSTGTGPTADHTTGHGYYIYIETSSGRTGYKARLISPQVPQSSTGSKCMTFWYFMYGQNVDRLNLYVQYGLGLPSSAFWTKRGTQGNRWNQASLTIRATQPFNVVFEGTKGNGYRGDIALDDLAIVDGPCAGSTTPNPQTPATSCNFESASICGFTQDRSGADRFDWSRDTQGTSSGGTGPASDHTLGTSAGHYMYIEASAPRRRGDKARLNSPIYSRSTTASCLKFWYHMYGRNMGTLNVYAVLSGRFQRIWSKSGNQGNRWFIASATVPVSSGTYQIVFEGIVGNGYQGDVAIDDYSITSGSCTTQGTSCNFDNRNLCTWTNDRAHDQFDWTLRHGPTPSGQTGPTSDHTSGNGYYVFIETSAPRLVGDRAWLVSESFSVGGPNCLQFWYNMKGTSIGTLRVWVWSQTGARTPIWELKGNQGNNWVMGKVNIPRQTTSYKIIMEGTRGQSVTGDIALDDISFSNATTCPLTPQSANPTVAAVPASTMSTTPTTTTAKITTQTTQPSTTRRTGGTNYSCDFTYDLCGWTQDRTDQYDWLRKSGPTMTVGTGPTGDHTTGRGYYMYVETSSPRRSGDKARLIGPSLNGNGQPQCFTFWYNMFGDHVAALNIYLKKGSSLGNPVWTRSGSQGSGWKSAQVQFTPTGSSRIVMEGVRGVSYRGDIAIDDTNVIARACPGGGLTTPAPQSIGQLACNFERSNLCGYTNDRTTDDFDWTRNAGSTSSSGTGPFNDHTLGTRSGHYMYIETSSPRRQGQKARLLSPLINSSGSSCVSFYYHMYGRSMGSLNIYVKQQSTSGTSSLGQPVWRRSGSQQNTWLVGQFTITPSSSFQLVFEGIVGNSFTGDIAIDDITVKTGSCGGQGECSFDNNNLCTWSNRRSGDNFDWAFGSRGTPTSGTGPSRDHTKGNLSGRYIFIETSSPRRRGQKAQLISALFQVTGSTPKCLRFWYHMYGNQMGTLNVYLYQNGSYPGTKLWSLSNNQGNQWKSGTVPVRSNTQYSIIFEGVVGSGYRGDIALDDLSMTTGQCALSPSNARPAGATTPTPTATTATTSGIPPTSTSGTFNCNFESNTCGWTQAKDDTFDWTRQRGSTTSLNTGPSADHTTGRGYYMYIETSAPRHNGDKARLVSPRQQPQAGPRCLRFWYHMYGAHINALNVYVMTGSRLGAPVFTRRGTQGNIWRQAALVLNTTSGFNVVFEGVRGVNIAGDIAIDDISLANGLCSVTNPTQPPSGSTIATCSFESNLCGYTNDRSGDNFDWSRITGHTSSTNTGPNNDHTLGTSSGHYMFIETSAPRRPGDKARLTSPLYLAATDSECLQFYYHMYGIHIGTLNVRLKTSGRLGSPVWTKSRNQGNHWNIAQVTLPATRIRQSSYQIVFEGIRGQGYAGDIAVDDIKLSKGACASPGSCSFEKGRCTWTNAQTGDDFDWRDGTGSTLSTGTGPSADHTLGTAAGHYQYLEASYPRRAGDKTWLVSQNFPPTTGGCFRFWYNMNGRYIGSLNVYIQYQGGSNLTLWSVSGDHGDKWLNGQAPIKSTSSYNIVIEGVRGAGLQGDIAIDDLSFGTTLCGVQPSEAVVANQTTPSPVSTSPATTPATGDPTCNFDVGSCGWTQDRTDNFDWIRHRGPTSSSLTGPRADHTSGSGYYYYIETSAPRRAGQKARLISPQQLPGTLCFSFWYHMYGQHVNSLNVYLKTRPSLGTPIFTRSRTQGNLWKQAKVDINPTVNFQIVIEGVVGSSYRGDIAIDDVAMSTGTCSQAGNTSLGCDFENSNLCGYTQDRTDVFDWTRGSGGTSSGSTGPTNDHTYSTSTGHYMYIEASSPRQPGDAARLISPTYNPSSATQCLEFWYNMYGISTGTLNVYFQVGGNRGNPKFTKQGNQGNQWFRAQIGIPTSFQPFQLVFEGVRGSSYQGDIAIDDIAVKLGSCGASPGNCNFELDTCSWSNSNNDTFDWQRTRGSTTSTGTGPSSDHTYGNSTGYYIFIESSVPRRPGDNAILQSAVFRAGPASCMKFYYNMYGTSIGTLRIWVKPQGGAVTKVWELSGDQGTGWNAGQVSVGGNSNYQVLLEAVRGNGYQGDIAIDDITFSSQQCNLTPAAAQPVSTTSVPGTTTMMPGTIPAGFTCSFDSNVCGWTQDHTDNFDWTRHNGGTSSGGTGPRTDHSGGGYYMYIETSSPRRPGDRARLISPKLNGAAQFCVTFYYHMYGPHINALNVYLAQNTTLGSPVWKKTGTQGNRWNKGTLQIPGGSASAGVTNVVFEGIRGVSYLGDIAIDDVSIATGVCGGGSASTGSPADCNFEVSNICNYKQDTTDNFDWSRNSRGTTSSSTGPTNDHTYGTASGHYMYIEASAPRRTGDVARLWTPSLTSANGRCISFWYHMYGRNMGTLNVYAVRNSTRVVLGNPVWTRSGTTSNNWFQQFITLPQLSNYNVVFEGVRGNGYLSDIAIDDVKMSPSCPPPGKCSCHART